MTTPTYDQASPSSIEWFGRRLIGKTLRNTPGAKDIPQEYMDVTPGVQTKGHFGTIVERYYYGINPGNQPCSPDFKEAGVELKTNALIKRRKGISAKERLVLQMISYDDIIHESFESSCFMAKSRLMMLISNKFNPAISMVDTDIVLARLVDFNQLPLTDQQIIREDWTNIAEKVRRG
jgi:DNA mismatch repair protein MutH